MMIAPAKQALYTCLMSKNTQGAGHDRREQMPQKNKPSKRRKGTMLPDGNDRRGLMTNVALAALIFVAIVTVYSFLAPVDKPEEVSLSQLAADVTAGKVQKVEVVGSDLNIVYKKEANAPENAPELKKTAHKEEDASLTETLANYGVTSAQMAQVDISIGSDRGAGYWILNLLPFLLPIVLLVFFIWRGPRFTTPVVPVPSQIVVLVQPS